MLDSFQYLIGQTAEPKPRKQKAGNKVKARNHQGQGGKEMVHYAYPNGHSRAKFLQRRPKKWRGFPLQQTLKRQSSEKQHEHSNNGEKMGRGRSDFSAHHMEHKSWTDHLQCATDCRSHGDEHAQPIQKPLRLHAPTPAFSDCSTRKMRSAK